jgi:hypothetical protein
MVEKPRPQSQADGDEERPSGIAPKHDTSSADRSPGSGMQPISRVKETMRWSEEDDVDSGWDDVEDERLSLTRVDVYAAARARDSEAADPRASRGETTTLSDDSLTLSDDSPTLVTPLATLLAKEMLLQCEAPPPAATSPTPPVPAPPSSSAPPSAARAFPSESLRRALLEPQAAPPRMTDRRWFALLPVGAVIGTSVGVLVAYVLSHMP